MFKVTIKDLLQVDTLNDRLIACRRILFAVVIVITWLSLVQAGYFFTAILLYGITVALDYFIAQTKASGDV